MSLVRIALANLAYPDTRDAAVAVAERAIADESAQGAAVVCFPECYIPGYRGMGKTVPPPDAAFLERAWSRVSAAAARGRIAVVLGTERITDAGTLIAALVVNPDGTRAGFQDKVQLDPSEDVEYVPGS